MTYRLEIRREVPTWAEGDRNLNGYDLEIDKIRLISEEIDKNDMNVEMYQAIGNSMT